MVDAIGGPTEDVGPVWDNDYCWQAQLAGFELVFVPEATMHYRVRTTSGARYRQARAWGESHARLTAKYGAPHPLRYALFCVKHLAQTLLSLARAARPIWRRRSVVYRMWYVGFAMGQLEGLKHVAAARRARAAKRRAPSNG